MHGGTFVRRVSLEWRAPSASLEPSWWLEGCLPFSRLAASMRRSRPRTWTRTSPFPCLQGSYVVLASESLCLVGVDVAAPQELRPGRKSTATELLRTFRSQLTAREAETIADISATRGDAEALRAFQDVWALKEAYAKALGLGLACDLTEVSFEDAIARQREAGLESRVVAVRFQTRKGGVVAAASDASRRSGSLPPWSFHLHALPGAHAVAVARGAPAAAVDAKGAFKGTFIEPTPSHERLQAALEESDPPFALLTMSDLVPEALHGAYEAAGGEIV